MESRQVKFAQMLEDLIERGGYHRNRKRISSALDISPAALSQYVRGQTRPTFTKLLAIADFFGVSLDYIVYGQVTETAIDYGPLARYIDQSLATVQARTSRHSAIVGRIGRVLTDRIDAVAAELAAVAGAAREGLLQDDEMGRLERYCRRVDLLSLNLEPDVIYVGGEPVPGRFLPVVAANLSQGSHYRILVPEEYHPWETIIADCRKLLAAQIGGDRVRENCEFRRTSTPVTSGACFYELDVTGLRAEEPGIHAQVSDYLEADRWLGYVLRPNRDSSDMLMDAAHTRQARASFDALWGTATRL